jgi:outer membrane protein TolC
MILFVFLHAAYAAAATPAHLTLDAYLDQVRSKSPLVSAARLHDEGGAARSDQGTETKANTYSLGVGANTDLGLNAKYTWNTAYANQLGTSFPSAGNYTSYNKLDLTLNLARNGFGSELGARQQLIRSGNKSQSLAGKYQFLSTMTQAEVLYWRLAFARQAVQVQRDGLARAQKQLDWAKRRLGLQLGDKSDMLQAQASYDLHNLDLNAAIEDERAAARAFNLLRNQDGESVPEAVAIPSLEDTLRMPAPAREGERLDVQAAAERTKAAQAQSQLDKEALKPNVDLVASYAWNARKPERPDAISNAFKDTYPTKSIAVTFSVPLDVPTWSRGIKGANQEIEAANYELDQTRLGEARDWNDLVTHLNETRSRLQLLGTMESVQREKFENERQRLLRGRTTTYTAITFEQDYANAQLLRLRTQAEVLQTLAQMKAYRGSL